MNWIGLALALGLNAYLCVALIFPEKVRMNAPGIFQIANAPATLRLQAANITDEFS